MALIEQGSIKAGDLSVQIENSGGTIIDPATETTLLTLKVQSTFSHGAKSSIGTSAVQMKSSSVPCNSGVMIKASSTNTGIVYVGSSSGVTAGSSDSTDGLPLSANDGIVIPVDNANDIYLIASAASQKVYWIAL